jgi:hypothetical protein
MVFDQFLQFIKMFLSVLKTNIAIAHCYCTVVIMEVLITLFIFRGQTRGKYIFFLFFPLLTTVICPFLGGSYTRSLVWCPAATTG